VYRKVPRYPAGVVEILPPRGFAKKPDSRNESQSVLIQKVIEYGFPGDYP